MKRDNPDQKLEDCTQSIYEDNDRNYGYRRIYLELRNQGLEVK
ncbi:IS3 family transposase [Alkalihalobacterium elongatum]